MGGAALTAALAFVLEAQWGPRQEGFPQGGYAAVWHVSPRGSDQRGDGTEARPWRTIRQALGRCGDAAAGRRYAVKVAAGEYREGTIALRPYVELYGGFDPATWRRDISAQATVLDGEEKVRVLVGADEAVLDGFHVRGGRVRGAGGALLCEGSSPVIRNNVFTGNGTLAPEPWNPKQLHETANDGGAIACLAAARPLIEANLFAGNRTEVGRGAAVAYRRAGGRLRGNVFLGNTAGTADPMRSSDGGAISVWDWSDPEVEGNLVLGNRAAARNDGGGIFVALWASPVIRGNIIAGNYADDDGGGLFIGGQQHHYGTPPDPMPPSDKYLVRVLGNILAGNANRAATSGALRVTMESRVLFANNIVAENLGPARFQRSAVTVIHNTFLNPVSYEELKERLGAPIFANNIFQGGFLGEKGVTPTYSNLREASAGTGNFGGAAGFLEDGGLVAARSSEFLAERHQTVLRLGAGGAEPLQAGRVLNAGGRWTVVDGVEGDALRVWGDFSGQRVFELLPGFRLRPDSPCIDAGDASHSIGEDREGRRRPLNGGRRLRPDAGAYEFDPSRGS